MSESAIINEIHTNSFVTCKGVYCAGLVESMRKSQNKYQAIWEAITNAYESIQESFKTDSLITIRFYYESDLAQRLNLEKIIIEDNGEGFTDTNFERMLQLKDNRKSSKNRGSGRVQLLHTFQEVDYESFFKEKNKIFKRSFILSKQPDFLEHNAILFYKNTVESNDVDKPKTTVVCKGLTDDSREYQNVDAHEFKKEVLSHYLPYFCSIRAKFPVLRIEIYHDLTMVDSDQICQNEIPVEDKTFCVNINYSVYNSESHTVEHTHDQETFSVRCFKLSKNILAQNKISLV